MIITRTPFRMSFFGGGTDYPAWYRAHGGSVLAAAIDKYCYLTCRYLPPFFEHRYRIVYSRTESCRSIDEIGHPAVKAVLKQLEFDRGIELHHDGDLPARSGMGSSSSFAVGLIHALHALSGRTIGRHQLALGAIDLEQRVLNETVGSQDQVMAAYGGFNHVVFQPDGKIIVHPVVVPHERLEKLLGHLMLFYTGILRTASDVASTYIQNIEERAEQFKAMSALVDRGATLLASDEDLTAFGELLDEGWALKRRVGGLITNDAIDGIYNSARKAGAIGGKLLGAGGGGFILLYVPAHRQMAVRRELGALLQVPFSFDFSGSQIVYSSQERDYSSTELDRQHMPAVAFQELKTVRKAI